MVNKKPPVKIKRWQYVQLAGLVTITVHSILCVLLLFTGLVLGLSLVHNKVFSWVWFIVGYGIMLSMTWYINRFFRWLLLRKRAKRLAKGSPEQEDDNKKSSFFKRNILTFIIVGIIIWLFYSLLQLDMGPVPQWLVDYWPYILGGIALVILLFILGQKWKRGGKLPDIGWFAKILGAILIVGVVWLLYYYQALLQKKLNAQPEPITQTGGSSSVQKTYPPLVIGSETTLQPGVQYAFDREVGVAFALTLSHADTVIIHRQMRDIPSQNWDTELTQTTSHMARGLKSECSGVCLLWVDKPTQITIEEVRR